MELTLMLFFYQYILCIQYKLISYNILCITEKKRNQNNGLQNDIQHDKSMFYQYLEVLDVIK